MTENPPYPIKVTVNGRRLELAWTFPSHYWEVGEIEETITVSLDLPDETDPVSEALIKAHKQDPVALDVTTFDIRELDAYAYRIRVTSTRPDLKDYVMLPSIMRIGRLGYPELRTEDNLVITLDDEDVVDFIVHAVETILARDE
jgi:hypothetical protein